MYVYIMKCMAFTGMTEYHIPQILDTLLNLALNTILSNKPLVLVGRDLRRPGPYTINLLLINTRSTTVTVSQFGCLERSIC